MEDTVTNYQFYMNVCRNPFGYSSDEVRTARLYICDHAESMDNLVGKLTRENEALKAELAEAKKDAELVDACHEFINSPISVESCERFNKTLEARKGK